MPSKIIGAAAAAILGSSNPFGALPPKQYDHWPTIPVIIVHESMDSLPSICYSKQTADALKALDIGVLGCELTLTGGRASDASMAQLLAEVPDRTTRRRLVAWGNTLKIEWDAKNNIKPSGCIVALPFERDLEPDVMNGTYRHELAHCNGWTEDHEGAIGKND